MKNLIVFFVFSLFIISTCAQSSRELPEILFGLKNESGRWKKTLLIIRDSNYYEFFKYTKKELQYDWGKTTLRNNGELQFESSIYNQCKFNPYENRSFFLNKKGLYLKRRDKTLNINGFMTEATEDDFSHNYKYNPIAKSQDTIIGFERLDHPYNPYDYAYKKYVELVKVINPDYLSLIRDSYGGPGSGYYNMFANGERICWNQDTSEVALILDFATLIHESVHCRNQQKHNSKRIEAISNIDSFGSYKKVKRFNKKNPDSKLSVDLKPNFSYMVNPQLDIEVGFPIEFVETGRMMDSISNKIKDSIGRISYLEKEHLASNVNGLYGLLEEYSAYSAESYFSIGLYEKMSKRDTSVLFKLLYNYIDNTTAYYQFNYFIGGYLEYIKEYDFNIYEDLINNENLKLTYTLLSKNFTDAINFLETIELIETDEFTDYCDVLLKERAFAKKQMVKMIPYLLDLNKNNLSLTNR